MSLDVYYCLFGLILLFPSLQTTDESRQVTNSGREFMVTFPKHGNSDTRLELVITSTHGPLSDVHISAPLREDINASTQLTMLSPGAMRVTLNSKLQLYGVRVEVKGIWITSPRDITVQGYSLFEGSGWSSVGGFMAFPVESLGREYVIVTYCKNYKCQFAVVATKNNTRVSISLRMDLINKVVFRKKTYTNGSLLEVTLKRYQTLQIIALGDLTGTRIESSEPIAVFAGAPLTPMYEDNSTSIVYTRDHLVDQLPPVSSWGSEYVISPFPNTMSEDYIRIVVYENTHVLVDGVLYKITTYDRYRQFLLPVGRHTIVTSDSPVLIGQFSQSTNDTADHRNASVAIVVPVGSWRSEYVFSPLSFIDAVSNIPTYVTIVTTTSCMSDVLLDGEYISSQWIEDDEYAHASFNLKGIKYHLSLKKHSCKLSGTIFGTAFADSWSMPLGWYFQDIWIPEHTSKILQVSTSYQITTATQLSYDIATPEESPATTQLSYDIATPEESPATTQLSYDIATPDESPTTTQLSYDIATPEESPTTKQLSYDITTPVESPITTQLSDISTTSLIETHLSDVFTVTPSTVVEINSQAILPTSVVRSELSDVLARSDSPMLTIENSLPPDVTAILHPSSNYLRNSGIFSETGVHIPSTVTNMVSTTLTGTVVVGTADHSSTGTLIPNEVTTTYSPSQSTTNVGQTQVACTFCRCKNSTLYLDKSLQVLKEHLAVDTHTLSATTRKYISIEDNRPSAVAVGCSGIVFLCLTGLLLSINDLIKLWSYWYTWYRKNESPESGSGDGRRVESY